MSNNVDSNGRLIWSKTTRDLLNAINAKYNNSIKYQTDIARYGKADFWEKLLNGGHGDCDDYALSKREALLLNGVPLKCLALATCWTEPPGKEYHAVLVVHTTAGDIVLDNRFKQPIKWNATHYKWHKIQVAGTPEWRMVG